MTIAMRHASTVLFHGNTAKAFDAALVVLTALGFRVIAKSHSCLDLVGPGMNSSRQPALLGASRIQVTRCAHELALEAELGGVRQMARFGVLFPLGLSLFLAIVLLAVFHFTAGGRLAVIIVLAVTGGNAILWLFLAPILTRSLRARACRAIDALLSNMALIGEST